MGRNLFALKVILFCGIAAVLLPAFRLLGMERATWATIEVMLGYIREFIAKGIFSASDVPEVIRRFL